MKKSILLILLFPVILLLALVKTDALPVFQDEDLTVTVNERNEMNTEKPVLSESITSPATAFKGRKILKGTNKRDRIVNYALSLIGTPYVYAGNSRNGFDCSGFTTHVFDQNGVSIKRSSGLQANEGIAVNRNEASPGDLVIFTGTDEAVREPGHVGIVISEPGDTIEFVHSSSSRSEGGVKISKVEGTGYDARFLEIRRVL